jgi:hypothetical protein
MTKPGTSLPTTLSASDMGCLLAEEIANALPSADEVK